MFTATSALHAPHPASVRSLSVSFNVTDKRTDKATSTIPSYKSINLVMPASLPPRKDPPARRMTRASVKEDHSAFQSHSHLTSVPSSQPTHSTQQPLPDTVRPPTHHTTQPVPASRHVPASEYRRYRTPVQLTPMASPTPVPLNQSHVSAPHQHVQQHQQTQQHTQQQHIIHSSLATQPLPSVSHATPISHQHKTSSPDHASTNPPINTAQFVAVSVGLSPTTMAPPPSGNVQYANPSYPNAGFFDQFNMSHSLPLSMPGPNSAVNVVRDMDRQGQPHNPQIHPRTAGHTMRKGLLQSPDMQYAEQTQQTQQLQTQQGQQQQPQQQPHQPQEQPHQQQPQRRQSQQQQQQQMLQRPPTIQAHPQQDIQPHPISQQHMQQQLYQPLDPQQNAQHLVMNQNAQFMQQSQVGMHNQAAQLQQSSHIASQDAHFDQHTYQIAHPGQLASVGAIGLQHQGEMHARKSVNAATQTELLGWNGTPQGRVAASVMGQQGAHDVGNAIAPGTLINPSGFAPSHIFDMGMGDMRQQAPQNPLALQHVQGQKVQQSPSGAMLSRVRKSPNQTTDISPRKRRQASGGNAQTVPATAVLTSGRTFSCSGCGQDFAQKRERDLHVRTVHERSFSCSKCSARFKTKSDANRHVRIVHDRVRPYHCPSCPSTFSERNKLRRHRETVHEKLRPFGCPVCPARFGELGNLRQHTSSLHPEATIDNAQIRSRAAAAAAAAVNSQIQS